MEDILSRLKSGSVIVADGAMGTMLQAAGLPTGMAPEAWLLESPDPVRGVHSAYIEAGSDLILSCTFGGTRTRLTRPGLADRVVPLPEVARTLVEVVNDESAGV